MSQQSLPNVVALMDDIRSRVQADIKKHRGSPHLGQQGAGPEENLQGSGHGLLHSEDLRAMNRGHAFAANLNPDSITSHRSGFLGRAILGLKRKCFIMLRDSLFREYFAQEQEFHAHLVRHINTVTRQLEEHSTTISRLEARVAFLESGSRTSK